MRWRKMDHKTSNNWKGGEQKQSSCWKVQNAIWWPSRDGKASNRPQSQRGTAGDKNPPSFRHCWWMLSGSCFHLGANIFNWQKGSRKLLGKQQEMGVGGWCIHWDLGKGPECACKGSQESGSQFPKFTIWRWIFSILWTNSHLQTAEGLLALPGTGTATRHVFFWVCGKLMDWKVWLWL